MEDITRAGISVGVSIKGKVNIPNHVAVLNFVSKTKQDIDVIVKKEKNI